jgi:outer membrane lipoprotein-sorting protein
MPREPRIRHSRPLAGFEGRKLEWDMAATGRTAAFGTLIWLSLSAPLLAQTWPQIWPWSTSPDPVQAVTPPPQPPQAAAPAEKIPLPIPAPLPKMALPALAAPPPSDPPPAIQHTAVTAAGPGRTVALDENQRSLVDRISLYLSSVQTLLGDFVQVAPDGSKTAGHFYIQKPGRVKFEYNPPSPIDIIADGRLVSVRNRTLDTQDLFPLSQTPLRFLLSERIDLRRETNIVGVYADDIFASIVIEERQPLVGTSRLMMMFDAKDLQLKQWTVTDAQGYDTTVAVYNLDPMTKPDPAIFTINTARNN